MAIRLGNRLEASAHQAVAVNPAFSGVTVRLRTDDGTLGNASVAPKPTLIIVANDRGRYHRLLPIRRLELAFTLRCNAKTAAGAASPLESLIGALEDWLDTTNLMQILSGPSIAVMLVTRQAAEPMRVKDLIREQTISIECMAVAAELTVQGSGVPNS